MVFALILPTFDHNCAVVAKPVPVTILLTLALIAAIVGSLGKYAATLELVYAAPTVGIGTHVCGAIHTQKVVLLNAICPAVPADEILIGTFVIVGVTASVFWIAVISLAAVLKLSRILVKLVRNPWVSLSCPAIGYVMSKLFGLIFDAI